MSQAHGISLGVERIGTQVYLAGKAVGTLTHDDYQVVTPFLESVFSNLEQDRVRMLFDIREFSGWEMRAAWDDLRIGLKHGKAFERIAIVGQGSAQERMTKVANWFTSGEVRYFEQTDAALTWLMG